MKSNRKKTENSIIKLLIDIHSLTGIEFLPSIFSLFSFGLSFVTLFKTDQGEFKFLLVMFCIFMVINSICFIFHGYHIHKYKISIENHRKKTLGYLYYHRESFKNVNYVQNNKDKLISLLYENSEGKYKSASDFYDKYLKNYFAKLSGLTDDEINSYKNNDKTFSDFYSIYYLHVNEATEALIKNIKDTYNRFITNTFSNIKKEIESYLSERDIDLPVSVTLKLFSQPCFESNNEEDDELFVYTSFRDSDTYHKTKRREIGQMQYKTENQLDFREAMKGPNYRYIYNNLEEEENSISSAYCYMYYNCGVTVSLRISNFKDTSTENVYKYYGFLCCDVLNDQIQFNPMDSHIADILDIYGHIITEFFNDIELLCKEKCISEERLFHYLYELAHKSKTNKM